MRIVLWGAGSFGERIIKRIPDQVVAIIDLDTRKQGNDLEGIPIIDYDEYEKKYSECFILVTPLINDDIISFLQTKNNYKYFLATDLPGEWFDYNERDEFCKYMYTVAESVTHPIIYGCNYHSILIASLVQRIKGISPKLMAEKSTHPKVVKEINERLFEVIIKDELTIENVEQLVIATGKDLEDVRFTEIRKIEAWDCISHIKEYNHYELKRFKDIHAGKRCFIIGNGPSLEAKDLDRLYKNKEICFGVNSIYDIYNYTQWRPTYYVVGDVAWIKSGEFDRNIRIEDYREVFVTDRLEKAYYKNCPYNVFHLQSEVPIGRKAKFSHDIVSGMYYGATILYTCMQLAVYMGFSELYLLGVDFTGGVNSKKTKYKHFDGNYDEGALYNQIIYNGYRAAKEEEKTGFKVYNVTRGGELELFERVNFDELFDH